MTRFFLRARYTPNERGESCPISTAFPHDDPNLVCETASIATFGDDGATWIFAQLAIDFDHASNPVNERGQHTYAYRISEEDAKRAWLSLPSEYRKIEKDAVSRKLGWL